MMFFIIAIVGGVIFGFATQTIIDNKGYEENWFWWGFFFGIVALIVAASKPENASRDNGNVAAEEKNSTQMISSGSWKCKKCGRINASYTGTCACGMKKSENGVPAKTAVVTKAKEDNELENIQKIKSYKDLLDSGVITQEEFEKKKQELLNM